MRAEQLLTSVRLKMGRARRMISGRTHMTSGRAWAAISFPLPETLLQHRPFSARRRRRALSALFPRRQITPPRPMTVFHSHSPFHASAERAQYRTVLRASAYRYAPERITVLCTFFSASFPLLFPLFSISFLRTAPSRCTHSHPASGSFLKHAARFPRLTRPSHAGDGQTTNASPADT